ncbi:hypothetical protein SS1G_09477 [Sclerotinia sclerotiorum 1980 UF-70]|uniref:T6SS Phospholipase effector Tle1-like catalytic domain-containing protein n=2 Tax=Sclerotinia sclerotiorum (strain ATCC 18683 / 1980 / Ss-1) TaxID=665079 RepID=A7EVW8_SCLS1|nr:hypothetical protein SS1G_09477 [Sclerotinia sclerotiorum 1980 UF-70]APA15707.1 hypothetical protein sscle_15g104770 [Sclerotinia sclerotiorum 1980 UF-70]EDN93610.1 hypothetical protein SS1G_09477 [Sclerotinia sclerotiorum 1980 UF-70]
MSSFRSKRVLPDSQIKSARKRIIICCDGTWQSAVTGKDNCPSNVTRLCRAINSVGRDPGDDEPWQQVVWYDSGVGTTSTGLAPKVEGAVGQGLEGNVIEAYNFCVLNWNPGDKIICFGFSRGAYTARAIAGLISDIGICSKSRLQEFPELWKLYRQRKFEAKTGVLSGKRFYGSAQYWDWQLGRLADPQPAFADRPDGELLWDIKPQDIDTVWARSKESMDVEVVGVFDTVGALGPPEVFGYELPEWVRFGEKPEWHNVSLSANIKHAFQALALDEHRNAFSPTLYYIKTSDTSSDEEIEKQRAEAKELDGKWKAMVNEISKRATVDDKLNLEELKRLADDRNTATEKLVKMEESKKMEKALEAGEMVLEQVWFPGYHIHIGGGSSDTLLGKDNMEEMSNITFAWMLDQIKKYVSINEGTIRADSEDRQRNFEELNKQREIHIKKEKARKDEGWGKWIWRQGEWVASTIAHPLTREKTHHHEERVYGWGTGDFTDSFTAMYRANGSKPRTPGRYGVDTNGKKVGETHEYIHPTTGFRVHYLDRKAEVWIFDDDHPLQPGKYRPIGLLGDNYKREKKIDDKGRVGYEYIFTYPDGYVSRLPEWPLGEEGCYERLAIEGSDAHEYVEELDRSLKTNIEPNAPIWDSKNAGFSYMAPANKMVIPKRVLVTLRDSVPDDILYEDVSYEGVPNGKVTNEIVPDEGIPNGDLPEQSPPDENIQVDMFGYRFEPDLTSI